jgi:hypothetical protein
MSGPKPRPSRELHLGVNVLSAGMHPAAWQHGGADPHWFTDPAYWNVVASSDPSLATTVFSASWPRSSASIRTNCTGTDTLPS